MYFSPFLALRYLQPKRTFVSIITLVSILGVALGVWLLTVVMAVFTGYGETIKENILGFSPHLVVNSGDYLENIGELMERLESVEGVHSVTPYVTGPVMLDFHGRVSGLMVRGILPPTGDNLKRWEGKIAKVSAGDDSGKAVPWGKFDVSDPYSAVIGEGIARSMGITVGDKILLHSIKNVEGLVKALNKAEKEGNVKDRKEIIDNITEQTTPQELTVTGVFDSGYGAFDGSIILCHLETAQVLYGFDLDDVHGIALRTEDGMKANQYRDKVREAMKLGERKRDESSAWAVAYQRTMRYLRTKTTYVALGFFTGVVLFFFIIAGVSNGLERAGRAILAAVTYLVVLVLCTLCIFLYSVVDWQFFADRNYFEFSNDFTIRVQTWMDMNRVIFNAVATERQAMYLILFMIMIVGSFTIMNTMITVTYQKRSEIGLLKALGARERQIAWVFLFQGMMVSLVGILLGIAMAELTIAYRDVITDWVGQNFGVDMFSEEQYQIDGGLPAVQSMKDRITIASGALIAGSLASLIPALIAASLQPAKALRSA